MLGQFKGDDMKTISLSNKIINDDYTEYVYNTYDIQDRNKTSVNINYDLDSLDDFDWNIGVICGNSGSGKTSILNEIGHIKECEFDTNKTLISNFDWLQPKEATFLLTSMGLASVPTWLRPFKILSNGEKYRAEVAYKVGRAKDSEVVLIDEYTSVVDRDVAKAMSFALQKYVRKNNKKVILASCHYDILEWLMPDWTCSPQKGGVIEKRRYHRRPKIELQISRVEYETWNFFKKHHYLSECSNKSYAYYLFEWDGKPVGISVVSPMPSGTLKNAFRGSRTVVLPDYQGMGIGVKISEVTGGMYINAGKRYYTKTINPALGEYRNKSKN